MTKGDESALIAGAVAGRSHVEIAAAAGVSVSTVQRRLLDPEILAAVQAGRSQQHREAVGRLNDGLQSAIGRLEELVRNDDPKVALRAVSIVLANVHKFTMAIEFDERLSLLEAEQLRVPDHE